MLAAVSGGDSQVGAFEPRNRFELRPACEPKKRPVARHRQHFYGQSRLARPRRQSHGAQSIHFPGHQRGRGHVRRHLNQFRVQPLFAKKAAVLRDVKIDKGNAPARYGNLDSLQGCLRCGVGVPGKRDRYDQKNNF